MSCLEQIVIKSLIVGGKVKLKVDSAPPPTCSPGQFVICSVRVFPLRRVLRFKSFERPAGGGNTQRKSQQPERGESCTQSEHGGQGSSSITEMIVRSCTPARDIKRTRTRTRITMTPMTAESAGGPTATELVSLSC